MRFIKCRAEQLAALRKPLDHEDLIDRILDGLDEDYKSLADIVQGRDTPILFDELHEKIDKLGIGAQTLAVRCLIIPGHYQHGLRESHRRSSYFKPLDLTLGLAADLIIVPVSPIPR